MVKETIEEPETVETEAETPAESKPQATEPEGIDVLQEAIEILEELEQLGVQCDEAKYRYENLKSQASDAKKHWEALANQLSDKTQERRRRREAEHRAEEEKKRNDANRPLLAKQTDEPEEDELWRSVLLSNTPHPGLKGKLLEKLNEADIETVGDLRDFTIAGNELTEIAGIGPGMAGKIGEAMDGFWKDWRSQQPVEEPSEPVEA